MTDDTTLQDLIEDYNVLKIYLSPIALYPKNSFQSKHTLNLPNRKIRYLFDQNNSLPEWKVLNQKYSINNNETIYTLQDFHAHTPSEHSIDDKKYDIEIHFVFVENDNPINILVIGYLFKISSKSSKMIRRLLANKPIKLPVIIDNNFLTYNGSLTKINLEDIHPLAVNWNVISKIKKITQNDFNIFISKCRGASILRDDNGRNVTNICC